VLINLRVLQRIQSKQPLPAQIESGPPTTPVALTP
jgi:hypothetical protein